MGLFFWSEVFLCFLNVANPRKKSNVGQVVIDFAVPLKRGHALRATIRCTVATWVKVQDIVSGLESRPGAGGFGGGGLAGVSAWVRGARWMSWERYVDGKGLEPGDVFFCVADMQWVAPGSMNFVQPNVASNTAEV